MLPGGPIFGRELLTAARRPQSYRRRADVAAFALAILASNIFGWSFGRAIMAGKGLGWWLGDRDPLSVQEMAWLSRTTFISFAFYQGLLTLFLVPELVARSLAQEKDRKTLAFLLATRLSSREIILGKLGAALLLFACDLAAALPIMVLLPLLGGVDPALVLLVYAATASTGFALAGLSILVATDARGGREAVRAAHGLASAWLFLPAGMILFLPWLAPRVYPWLAPVCEWALASSPVGPVAGAFGLIPRGEILGSLARMIGLQVVGGALLVLLAIARLRPAYRDQEGAGARGPFAWWTRRRRWRRRPPCGDDPVLWREMYPPGVSPVALLVGLLVVLGMVGLVGLLVYHVAWPALLESWAQGYRSPVDTSRIVLNMAIRMTTVAISFGYVLVAAGLAAEGVAVERARDTWSGLLATPLTGREILRAKQLGVAWRLRGGVIALVGLWSIGLLAGAVHPLGFAAALVALAAATWFFIALGTYASLMSRDLTQATNRILVPTLLLTLSGMAVPLLPAWVASVLMGAGSTPFLLSIALISFRDLREVLGSGFSQHLAGIGFPTGEGPLRYLATYLIGVIGALVGAAILTRTASERFDEAAGRPHRAPGSGNRPGRGRRDRARPGVGRLEATAPVESAMRPCNGASRR